MININIIDGKLINFYEELKNDLRLLGCGPTQLKIDDNSNLSGNITIGDNDAFNEYDILNILTRHSAYFKVEVTKDSYNGYQLFSDFIWDGKILIQLHKDKFGSIYEIEYCNWILD